MITRISSRIWGCVIVLVSLVVVTGCSFGPNDLPSVRAGVSSDFEVTLQFDSVLNLPSGADVMMNGLRVGQVKSTRVTADGVDVTVGLSADARVPADTTAIIRQNTLLGDTYLAFTPPARDVGQSGHLTAGAFVPRARTTSPPQLEDTIAVLAYFVNGGSIQKVQDTMATLNKTMPALRDVRRMAATVATDLGDLADQTSEIDRLLVGLDRTSTSFQDRAAEIAGVFGEQGAYYWKRVANSVVAHISTLLPSVGSIFIGGVWLIPMLKSIARTTEAGRGMWDKAPATATRVSDFLRTTVLPFAERPSVNVTSVRTGSGDQLIGDATTLLRMLGAVR
ncbi:MlaD family protein [Gordonia soli]|nr:MlaD family protein [Gordonia soli]